MIARAARPDSPAAVESFAESLAEWLSSFTVPQELAAEMAAACSAGAPWAAALAGTSVRRAGWDEREALAWGIAIGGLAGALDAARRSLAVQERDRVRGGPRGRRAAEGPALPLLAADGLIAAAHEALSSLDAERLRTAMDALAGAFADGGPWREIGPDRPRPAWPALVPCALSAAAADDPGGPWAALARAWDGAGDPGERSRVPEADEETRALFAEAAAAADAGGREGTDAQRF